MHPISYVLEMLQAFTRSFSMILQCLITNCYSLLPQSILFFMTCVNGTLITKQGLRVRTNVVYSNKVKIKTVGYTIGNGSYAKWDSKMDCQLSMWHFSSLPCSLLRSSLPSWEWMPGVILPEWIAYMAYSLPVYNLPPLRNYGMNLPFQSGSLPHYSLL